MPESDPNTTGWWSRLRHWVAPPPASSDRLVARAASAAQSPRRTLTGAPLARTAISASSSEEEGTGTAPTGGDSRDLLRDGSSRDLSSSSPVVQASMGISTAEDRPPDAGHRLPGDIKRWVDSSVQQSPLHKLGARLQRAEVDEKLSRSLLQELLSERPSGQWNHDVDVFSAAARVLMSWCAVTGPIKLKQGGPAIIAFIGPTGVGKTTTLAKLAALAAHREQNSVGLITADVHRIGAVEQMKVYSRLLSLPLAVVNDGKEFKAALDEYQQRDVVFVDTAGQSPSAHQRLEELEEMLVNDTHISRLLVLSASTKQVDQQHILKRFDSLGYDGVIVTKLDESRSHGILINAPHWSGRPLVCLGNGQAVPSDLEMASRERVVDLVLDLSGQFPDLRQKSL